MHTYIYIYIIYTCVHIYYTHIYIIYKYLYVHIYVRMYIYYSRVYFLDPRYIHIRQYILYRATATSQSRSYNAPCLSIHV